MATYKSPVYATKVDVIANVVIDDVLYLGEIQFNDLKDGFVKALKLYNKNANRHITMPSFVYRGHVYQCSEYGEQSKTGRGTTWYWELSEVKTRWVKVNTSVLKCINAGGISVEPYVMMIPKSKVKLPDAKRYVIQW